MMPKANVERAVQRLGMVLAFPCDCLDFAREHALCFPPDFKMAAANAKLCASMFHNERTALLALLNHTDPADVATARLNILAGDLEVVLPRLSNLALQLERLHEAGPSRTDDGAPALHAAQDELRAVCTMARALQEALEAFRFAGAADVLNLSKNHQENEDERIKVACVG